MVDVVAVRMSMMGICVAVAGDLGWLERAEVARFRLHLQSIPQVSANSLSMAAVATPQLVADGTCLISKKNGQV